MTRAICTRWPELDPLEVSRWPWHRTAFYVEWLKQLVDDVKQAEQAAVEAEEQEAERQRQADNEGSIAALEQLPGMGAQFRQVS